MLQHDLRQARALFKDDIKSPCSRKRDRSSSRGSSRKKHRSPSTSMKKYHSSRKRHCSPSRGRTWRKEVKVCAVLYESEKSHVKET